MALLFNYSEVTSLSRVPLGSHLFLGEERNFSGKRGELASGAVLPPKLAGAGSEIFLSACDPFMVLVIIIRVCTQEY